MKEWFSFFLSHHLDVVFSYKGSQFSQQKQTDSIVVSLHWISVWNEVFLLHHRGKNTPPTRPPLGLYHETHINRTMKMYEKEELIERTIERMKERDKRSENREEWTKEMIKKRERKIKRRKAENLKTYLWHRGNLDKVYHCICVKVCVCAFSCVFVKINVSVKSLQKLTK
jgi:hypothetical protein